jgi:metallo-beta-lactamase class B
MKPCTWALCGCAVAAAAVLGPSLYAQRGSDLPAGPPVQVTVNGRTWTQQELFQRNVGGPDDMTAPFPPHKIIGNVYYVGTKSLSSYLITTPQGHILINSTYERNIPTIQKSVEQLGFKFTDIKILLGSHAHGDHMEGDALFKELTGAKVMAMEQDLPALKKMMPGGKPHPIDRVLHDGDEIKLGGTTVVAHLTAGHTPGCTSFTFNTTEGGKTYDVIVLGSIGWNPGYVLVNNPNYPSIADDYRKSFASLRKMHVDVFLASHGSFYNLDAKYKKLGKDGENPFIDPKGFQAHIDEKEKSFKDELARQQALAK